ncbi:MAG: protein kinase, partial [Gemmatimonadetes bacterium]|nr:protein kinase [Gemmatimonadota bacterium]
MTDSLQDLRSAIADRYSLGKEIGRGGMAVVYAAEDLRHHRQVAIKILSPDLAAAVGTERFMREVEVAARLSHPHIVPLFDSGNVGGVLYYVMPLLDEGSLRGLLNQKKQLSVDEAIRIISEIAAGLDFAHEAGVIHRDVKPANVMFAGGEATLADFGVATAVASLDDAGLTATGIAVGTPSYMSPEQSAGAADVDARSDVFALGCIAYEVLAGAPPFEGPTPQAVHARKMAGEIRSLRVVRDTVPIAAEKVIEKALSSTPADRYESAGEFAAALRAAVQTTDDAGLAQTGRTASRSGRKGAVLIAAVGVVLAIWHFGLGGLPGTVRPAAASFFQERDRVVVSDFENRTDDPALGLAVRQAVITDIHQSPHVNVVDYAQLGSVFQRMQVPDTTRLTAGTALEIARREGFPAVIGGNVAPIGEGYLLTAQIVEASTGEVVVGVRETADDGSEVLDAVERLSHLLRRHLGESLGSLRRSRPLPEVSTTSMEALGLYAQALGETRRARPLAAIPLLERAVQLDDGFATAYTALATIHGNQGQMVQAQAAMERAYALGRRLPDRERYRTGASYHRQEANPDSAAYYYELLLRLEPDNSAAVNNLGDLYEDLGRYEDALVMYRRSLDIDPESVIPYYNLMSAARTLGLHALADSGLAMVSERFPGSFYQWGSEGLNAYYAGDFDAVDVASRILVERFPGFPAGNAQRYLAATAAHRGHVRHAMALTDSAMASYAAIDAGFMIGASLGTKMILAWAGGQAHLVVPDIDRTLAAPAAGAVRWEHARLSIVALGYSLAGDYEAAEALLPRLDSLAAQGTTFPIDGNARALLSLAHDDPEVALEHLERARIRDYGVVRVLSRILAGDAYAALGDTERAVEAYEGVLTSYRVNWRDSDTWAPL